MIDGFEDNVSLHTQRDNILKNKDKIIIAKKSGMIIFIDHLDLAILEVLVFFNQIQDNTFPISLKLYFVFLLFAAKLL